jgi:VIT1/CCC1 family predicted Fe2+/Mn2+ transporter
VDEKLRRELVRAQRLELTEYRVYKHLAGRDTHPHNREVLERIAKDEKRHYDFWAQHTGERPGPYPVAIGAYTWLARLLGLTFAIKLMEKAENRAQVDYGNVTAQIPEAAAVIEDERGHENELTKMVDEERLRYVGSVVLGLNDALVELTGALAGYTLALGTSRLIAVIGLITGIAAALSMAASEYLSTKSDADDARSAPKAALYTGAAYLVTVLLLVAPFLVLPHPLLSLTLTVGVALVVILAFSFYVAIARDESFHGRFSRWPRSAWASPRSASP